jgi:type I restriction enzyme S subunit
VNNKYLGHFISSIFFQDFVQLICGGSAQENISKAQLEIFNIIIPPSIEEQTAIATYLDHKTQTIDKIVGNIQNQISTLKELRKTLINDVVTGKIKVVE